MKWQCTTKAFKDVWIKTLVNTCNMQISDGTIPGLFLRYYVQSRRISFFLAYRNKITGKRKILALGRYNECSVADVKKHALEIRQSLWQGQDPLEELELERKRREEEQATKVTIDKAFEEYMEKYAKMYKKPSTQLSNQKEYELYIEPKFGGKNMREIEERHVVDAYGDWVKATSFATANKALSLFSSLWNWCETYKYVPRDCNPCKYIKKGSNEKFKAVVLDADGYKRLFQSFDKGMQEPDKTPRLFRALKILALTGCRCSEITDLERDEVALADKVIHLKDSKTGARDVKLSDAAVAEIQIALSESKNSGSKYVFPGVRDANKPISNITKPFEWALKDAGLPHMRIHDLRHSFITMGANLGENMNAMKDAAGHSRLTTTEHYTHMADAQTFKAVNNIAAAICE